VTATYKIAEVARRSGFKPSTLRYYEELGLVPPVGRTPAGYRMYDDSSLARLAFVARAKQLGCTLDEIIDLAVAWEGERCEPIQRRLRALVAAKIADAQDRVAEMTAFTAELQEAAVSLAGHTPDGPCDDDCGCAPRVARTSATSSAVRLTAKPRADSEVPIACALGATDMPGRLAAWQAALAPVVTREPICGGVRLVFPAGTAVAALADLASAEHDCCMFFGFAITIDNRGVALEVTGPDDAIDLVHSLFGAAA
jgi:MerR family copper efflux transcriptional regulator